MSYTYDYPHPAVTVDIAVFTLRHRALCVLLIQRAAAPYKGRWALPGGFVEIDEGLEEAARRELKEETGVDAATVDQLRAFGDPGRDPRERVISVAHVALLPEAGLAIRADSDAAEAGLFPVDDLPAARSDDGQEEASDDDRILAFDHDRIVAVARERLAAKATDPLYALRLLPGTFTLPELQAAYECLAGSPADRRNFRKRVLGSGCIEPTGEQRKTGNRRPATLYRRTVGSTAVE